MSKTLDDLSQLMHLSLWLGASEARTESYLIYGEGVLELATTPELKNTSSATSSAGWQTGVVRSCEVVKDKRLVR